MQTVNTKQLEKLSETLRGMREQFPKSQRAYHERVAQTLKQEIYWEIAATTNSTGKLASYQEEHVGSRGGYAAIRARGGESGANSPGAITNYVENGHKIAAGARATRKPTTRKYRPRIKVGAVQGRHFYQHVRSRAMQIAMEEMDEFLTELTEAANEKG